MTKEVETPCLQCFKRVKLGTKDCCRFCDIFVCPDCVAARIGILHDQNAVICKTCAKLIREAIRDDLGAKLEELGT